MFLYRDDYYNDSDENHNLAECIIAKNRHGETRTVDMHVKALRQKLGEDIITTVRGVGYKMV